MKIFVYEVIWYCLFFDQTCAKLRKMDQKLPNPDFQPQRYMSNIDFIHLKMIFYLEYLINRTFFIIAMIWLIH